jgi:hypothetical protein
MSEITLERLIAQAETVERRLNDHAVRATGVTQLVAVGRVRDDLARVSEDARDVHRDKLMGELDARAHELAQLGQGFLLEQVGVTWGLSWTSAARLLGVSDTAIRKWRRGEALTPENLRQLARLVAALGLIKEQQWVTDVAAWLEMRLAEASTLTPIDLYRDRLDLLFDLATRRVTPQETLDKFDPDWREKYAVDDRLDVTRTEDGPVLRVRNRDRR